VLSIALFGLAPCLTALGAMQIGREVSVPQRLADNQEFQVSIEDLIEHGRKLFVANWTDQEGGGRPC